MKQTLATVTENVNIAKNTFRMKLAGDTSSLTAPGQFINIQISGFFLRRPISVCEYNDHEITIIYKTVGGGTKRLSELPCGETLDILCGLGNGFDAAKSGDAPVLIGGGAGVPPLLGLCRILAAQGKNVRAILGFNTQEEVFGAQAFRDAGAQVFVTTADGSAGTKGFVTDVLQTLDYTYFYTCGPMPMFRAIERIAQTSGQFSFEERMGCGFGACMGCMCKTKSGSKRICREGPVLEREEIVW